MASDSDEDWLTVSDRNPHVTIRSPKSLNNAPHASSRGHAIVKYATASARIPPLDIHYGGPAEPSASNNGGSTFEDEEGSGDSADGTKAKRKASEPTTPPVDEFATKTMFLTAVTTMDTVVLGSREVAREVVAKYARLSPLLPVIDPRFFPESKTSHIMNLCTGMSNRLDDMDFYRHKKPNPVYGCHDRKLALACLNAYLPLFHGHSSVLFKSSFHGALAEARLLLGEHDQWYEETAEANQVSSEEWAPEQRMWQLILRLGGFTVAKVVMILFNMYERLKGSYDFAAFLEMLDLDDLIPMVDAGLEAATELVEQAPPRMGRVFFGGPSTMSRAPTSVMAQSNMVLKGYEESKELAPPELLQNITELFVTHTEEDDEDQDDGVFTSPLKPKPTRGKTHTYAQGTVPARPPPTDRLGAQFDADLNAHLKRQVASHTLAHVRKPASQLLVWYELYFMPKVVMHFLRSKPDAISLAPISTGTDDADVWNYQRFWLYAVNSETEITTSHVRIKNPSKPQEQDDYVLNVRHQFQEMCAEAMQQAIIEGREAYIQTIKDKTIPKSVRVPTLLSHEERRRIYVKLVAAVINLNNTKNPKLQVMVQRSERLNALTREVEALVWTYSRLAGRASALPW